MSNSGFSKIGANVKRRLYGPRGVLACGYAASEQDALLDMIERFNFKELPVIFAAGDDAESTLGALLALPAGHGRGQDSALPRTVILSGVTEKELMDFMAAWKRLGLPRQNWASLTPTSEGWKLVDLLTQLDLERAALAGRSAAQTGK